MYIFLDVDGVLNTKDDWNRKMYSLNENCIRICIEKTSIKRLFGHCFQQRLWFYMGLMLTQ